MVQENIVIRFVTEGVSKLQSSIRSVNDKIRNLGRSMKQFQSYLLGILFFGMAMQRFFQRLIQPALDLIGVFDLLNIVLALLFLPTGL